MTHKTDARIIRIPTTKEWPSRWFALKRHYQENLVKDVKVREYLSKKLKEASYSKIEIEKEFDRLKVIIYTPKPGLIIGKGGGEIEKIKKEIEKNFLKKGESLEVNVIEEKRPALSAQVLVYEAIADLEKRVPYRRVLKRIISEAKSGGALGCKVILKGRLGGVEIARAEKLKWGSLPLTTLRSDIDFAKGEAQTLYGKIGVKVWVYKGEVFKK